MRKELSNENRQLSAQEIQNILLEYPYFQAARLLYLEKIKETPLYKEALHKEAIYAPDRKILFKMTEAVRHRWTQLYEVPNTQGSTYNNSFSLIDKFLENYSAESTEEQSKEQKILEKTIFNPAVASTDYFSTFTNSEKITSNNQGQMDLIDSFIEKVQNNIPEVLNIKKDESNSTVTPIITEDDTLTKSGDEAFLTESLAKIYIKQKRYSKALEIIKKLSLKYPEKNIYFADQIRFLVKLIINIKTE